jgi:hypothetical protein
VSTQARSPIPALRGDGEVGGVADLLRREHHPVRAVLQDPEDDPGLFDVGDPGDDAALGLVGGREHDLQRDLGRVAEHQQRPLLGPGCLAGEFEAVGIGDLDVPAELHGRVRGGQLGAPRLVPLVEDHHVGGGEIPGQLTLAREEHLPGGRRQGFEIGDVGGDDAVDALVHGLLDDRVLQAIGLTDVQPAELHGSLPTSRAITGSLRLS